VTSILQSTDDITINVHLQATYSYFHYPHLANLRRSTFIVEHKRILRLCIYFTTSYATITLTFQLFLKTYFNLNH